MRSHQRQDPIGRKETALTREHWKWVDGMSQCRCAGHCEEMVDERNLSSPENFLRKKATFLPLLKR